MHPEKNLTMFSICVPQSQCLQGCEGVLVVICVSGNSLLAYGTVTAPLTRLSYLIKTAFSFSFPL